MQICLVFFNHVFTLHILNRKYCFTNFRYTFKLSSVEFIVTDNDIYIINFHICIYEV